MQESDEPARGAPRARWSLGVVALTALATLVLGIYWGPLIDAAQRATFFFAS
jgi:hypothetical protein